ncbi:hypothetical protein ACA910_021961 [Epithemia clementina (nom. ined.)]
MLRSSSSLAHSSISSANSESTENAIRGVKRRRTDCNLWMPPATVAVVDGLGCRPFDIPRPVSSESSGDSSSSSSFFFSSAGSDDSLLLCGGGEKQQQGGGVNNNNSRKVDFSTVCVRELALSSFHASSLSSSCNNVPLRLGWEQERQYECTIDDYENRPGRNPNGPRKLLLEERRERLGLPSSTVVARNQHVVSIEGKKPPALPSSPPCPALDNTRNNGIAWTTSTTRTLSAAERRARFIAVSTSSSFSNSSDSCSTSSNHSGLLPE